MSLELWKSIIIKSAYDNNSWGQVSYDVGAAVYSFHAVGLVDNKTVVGNRAIDIGCAFGTMALYLRAIGWEDVIALDRSTKLPPVEYLESNGISFVMADIDVDSVPGAADLIIFTETIEHIVRSPLIAMRKLYDSLSPGGTLILSTPDAEDERCGKGFYRGHPWYIESWKDIVDVEDVSVMKKGHWYIYNKDEVRDIAMQVGFTVEMIVTMGRHIYAILRRTR